MHSTKTSLVALFVATAIAAPQPIGNSAAVPAGKKVQWVGHSFHWFLPEPVAKLAAEAGIKGHQTVNVDRIGGSLPCQHWNKGGTTNTVKENLKAGKADVLTLATREPAPDECIPKFVKLAASKRPDMKVMVQETWIVQSAQPQLEACEDWGCNNRDAATWEMIEKTRTTLEQPYKKRLQIQMAGLNKEMKNNMTSLVPVYSAILSMRQMVVKGQIPGVAKQSALFQDKLGHAKKQVQNMASYMWFAAMYGIDPQGMKSLGEGSAPGLEAILQKLAWETLTKDGANGLGGQ